MKMLYGDIDQGRPTHNLYHLVDSNHTDTKSHPQIASICVALIDTWPTELQPRVDV